MRRHEDGTMTILTVEVAETLAARLAEMAQQDNVSVGEMVARALEAFVAEDAAMDAAIREGEADADAGRIVPAAEVFAALRGRIAGRLADGG
jgi:predicted transcriptional regulator